MANAPEETLDQILKREVDGALWPLAHVIGKFSRDKELSRRSVLTFLGYPRLPDVGTFGRGLAGLIDVDGPSGRDAVNGVDKPERLRRPYRLGAELEPCVLIEALERVAHDCSRQQQLLVPVPMMLMSYSSPSAAL
jgi:hypothetical protein